MLFVQAVYKIWGCWYISANSDLAWQAMSCSLQELQNIAQESREVLLAANIQQVVLSVVSEPHSEENKDIQYIIVFTSPVFLKNTAYIFFCFFLGNTC